MSNAKPKPSASKIGRFFAQRGVTEVSRLTPRQQRRIRKAQNRERGRV